MQQSAALVLHSSDEIDILCILVALQANMWQMSFATEGGALKEIEHGLRVNEQVLRWIVLKREMLSKLPNTYKVARKAESAMAKREASAVTAAT